jgi:hypothetical protein
MKAFDRFKMKSGPAMIKTLAGAMIVILVSKMIYAVYMHVYRVVQYPNNLFDPWLTILDISASFFSIVAYEETICFLRLHDITVLQLLFFVRLMSQRENTYSTFRPVRLSGYSSSVEINANNDARTPVIPWRNLLLKF